MTRDPMRFYNEPLPAPMAQWSWQAFGRDFLLVFAVGLSCAVIPVLLSAGLLGGFITAVVALVCLSAAWGLSIYLGTVSPTQ